jgi:hypothetical protein
MRCRRPQSTSSRPPSREKDSLSTKESPTIERKKRKLNKFILKREKTKRSRPLSNSSIEPKTLSK